jgi:hypothetical protein
MLSEPASSIKEYECNFELYESHLDSYILQIFVNGRIKHDNLAGKLLYGSYWLIIFSLYTMFTTKLKGGGLVKYVG